MSTNAGTVPDLGMSLKAAVDLRAVAYMGSDADANNAVERIVRAVRKPNLISLYQSEYDY